MNRATHDLACWRYSQAGLEEVPGSVITEMPVSLTVNGEAWLSFMCTPIDLEALAIGFLYNEGFIKRMDEVALVHACSTGENIDVWLHSNIKKPESWVRTSGCTGGFASSKHMGESNLADRTAESAPNIALKKSQDILNPDQCTLNAEQIVSLMAQISEAQSLYRLSGGVHSSAISDGQQLLLAVEDIGSHNTLDKIIGRCLQDGIPLPQPVLVTSGRVSAVLMQKAVRMGVDVVISRSAPSSLAVKLAGQAGITLVGYAREDRFTIYTHPGRIIH
jgi:FdhD protein